MFNKPSSAIHHSTCEFIAKTFHTFNSIFPFLRLSQSILNNFYSIQFIHYFAKIVCLLPYAIFPIFTQGIETELHLVQIYTYKLITIASSSIVVEEFKDGMGSKKCPKTFSTKYIFCSIYALTENCQICKIMVFYVYSITLTAQCQNICHSVLNERKYMMNIHRMNFNAHVDFITYKNIMLIFNFPFILCHLSFTEKKHIQFIIIFCVFVFMQVQSENNIVKKSPQIMLWMVLIVNSLIQN